MRKGGSDRVKRAQRKKSILTVAVLSRAPARPCTKTRVSEHNESQSPELKHPHSRTGAGFYAHVFIYQKKKKGNIVK